MAGSYVPLLILFAASAVAALGFVAISTILNPRRPTPQKDMPYESGMIPLGDTRAVEVKNLGWSAFVAMTLFVVVLAVGLLYEWKKGGLEWD